MLDLLMIIILSLIILLIIYFTYREIRYAPTGEEDDNGFHLIGEPELERGLKELVITKKMNEDKNGKS